MCKNSHRMRPFVLDSSRPSRLVGIAKAHDQYNIVYSIQLSVCYKLTDNDEAYPLQLRQVFVI